MPYLIDISNANGPVTWSRVKDAEFVGVWLKATEGASFIDQMFVANRAGAKGVGLRAGAYHYARPDVNPTSPGVEADFFCSVVKKLGRTDLRPVLDLEVKAPGLEWWARQWCRAVEKRLGVFPLVYGSTAFLNKIKAKAPIGGGLWLASYGADDGRIHVPDVPAPWKSYVAHQYTSKGKCPGVGGLVDRSYALKLRPILAHPVLGLLSK